MENKIQIIDTGDGSHTILNLEMDETYHSRHGALRESQHVFIRHGLDYWLKNNPERQELSIFEMGMGTGLNLILSIEQALNHPNRQFFYTTLEAYPLSLDTVRQLNYLSLLSDQSLSTYFEKTHELPWEQYSEILNNFSLEKRTQLLEDFSVTGSSFDLIYYDAFAPNKQPELWTLEVMTRIYAMMKSNGVFVTYSAKGQLKRDLKSLGLVVETLPGPPGKAEMIRAIKT